MHRKRLDLLISIFFAMSNIIWALFPNRLPVIATILALPLAFFLPGYSLLQALFPKRPFSGLYCFIFSIGLSLVIDILGGFILNVFSTGLRVVPWSVFLGGLTIIFSLIAMYVRKRYSTDEIWLPRFGLAIHEYLLLGLSIIIVILSVRYSVIGALQQPRPGFTQLWLLPSPQTHNGCVVSLGIRSFEVKSTTYRIAISVNEVSINARSSITLTPQEEWTQLVPINLGSSNTAYVDVKLYILGKPESAYREVHITLNGQEKNKTREVSC